MDVSLQDKLINKIDTSLSEEDKQKCEGLITEEEAIQAMKTMINNKSPGSDGLSVEFFKTFWHIIGKNLIEVYNYSYGRGELTESQKLGLVSLIYKKGDKADLNNWRPISLLNVDYKILAKVMANRLRKVIGKICNSDQCGYIPGREIGDAIIFTRDVIEYAQIENKPLIVISLDQTKAFDRLNRDFLFKVLTFFNLDDNFIQWVKLLYNNTNCKIKCNGFCQETFHFIKE